MIFRTPPLPTGPVIQTEAFRSFARKREMEILPRRIRGEKKREKQYCRDGELRSKKDKRNGEVPLCRGEGEMRNILKGRKICLFVVIASKELQKEKARDKPVANGFNYYAACFGQPV